jgi:hypothetical protein
VVFPSSALDSQGQATSSSRTSRTHLKREKAHSTCAAWWPLHACITAGGALALMKSNRKSRPGCQPEVEAGAPSPGG